MSSMSVSDQFYAKVIHNKGEEDGLVFLGSETCSVLGRCVAIGGEVGSKAFVGYLTGLEEAIHAFPDLDRDVAVVDAGDKVVLFHDAFCDGPDWDLHVFVDGHWRVQIEVLVSKQEKRRQGGECAIKDQFGGGDVGRGSADIARAINEIPTNNEVDTEGFFFVGTNIDNNTEVHGITSCPAGT